MSVEYAIVCDGCAGIIDASGRSAAAARGSVRRIGGRTDLPGGKDLCPDCLAAGRDTDGNLKPGSAES